MAKTFTCNECEAELFDFEVMGHTCLVDLVDFTSTLPAPKFDAAAVTISWGCGCGTWLGWSWTAPGSGLKGCTCGAHWAVEWDGRANPRAVRADPARTGVTVDLSLDDIDEASKAIERAHERRGGKGPDYTGPAFGAYLAHVKRCGWSAQDFSEFKVTKTPIVSGYCKVSNIRGTDNEVADAAAEDPPPFHDIWD